MFKVSDCPQDRTMMEWIKQGVGWKHWDAASETLTLPGVSVDPSAALADVRELFQRVCPVYWKSQPPGALTGLSITCNPSAPSSEWHHGSFGSEKYRAMPAKDYFTAPAADAATARKDGYLDALSFRARLPQLQGLPTIERFLDGFNFPVVRSTVRVIDGSRAWPSRPDGGGMHVDSPTTELLRLNLCITGTPDFGLEYDNGTLMLDTPGQVVAVNTDRMHRAWIAKRSDFLRVHLIIDIAPWLTYHAEEDAWSLNEFYGKVHPFDMVRTGLIHKGM